uniref:Gamma-aminobutyric acid type B receptor subunit 2 n=1 Tax=Clytia hemisphaerica TaxID=252671 RepID=A0A7M5URL4_9CNID
MSRQLIILFFTILTTTECISNKTAIHVGALIPQLQFRDRFCFGSSIKLAVEKINNSSFILPDHHIILHLKETHGRVGFALESLYQLLYTKPTKVAILGPGFSAPSKAVAELCTVFGTLQVSYSAIDPSLMSQLQYPFFFRSTPSIQSFNKVKISFFKHFGWKRVAVLYDYTDNLFFQTTDHLSKMLIANNFTNLMISGFDDDVHTRMDKLQQHNVRIIVGEFSKKGARKVFCEAYKRKMYGSKYVWMIMQGLSDTWFEDANDIDCNSTQLLIASEGYFRATRSNLRQDNVKTLFGKTGEEIWEEIKAKKISDYYPSKTTLSSADVHPGATFAFDATVALAEALHKAEIGGIVDFETYDYKNYETTFAIGQLLLGTTLEGVTGSMKYDMATRERLGEVEIQQFRKGKYCTVARHYTASDVLVFDPINSKKMFPDDVIPRDHPVIVREAILYSLSLVSGLWAISWLGFLLALVFLFVNIKYSNIKVIKMSSPKINNIICFGCMLCYVAVVLYGLDSRMIDVHYIPLTCNSIAIMLSIGFTLAFGGLFSKTFRVYRVFTASKNLTRVVS